MINYFVVQLHSTKVYIFLVLIFFSAIFKYFHVAVESLEDVFCIEDIYEKIVHICMEQLSCGKV